MATGGGGVEVGGNCAIGDKGWQSVLVELEEVAAGDRGILAWENVGVANLAGVISLTVNLFIWMTSLPLVKRINFELFFYTYQLYAVFIFFLALYVGDFNFSTAGGGIFLFILDRFLRLCQSRRTVNVISASCLPCGTVELICNTMPSALFFFKFKNYHGCNGILLVSHQVLWMELQEEQPLQPHSNLIFSVDGPYEHASPYHLKYQRKSLLMKKPYITYEITSIKIRKKKGKERKPSIVLGMPCEASPHITGHGQRPPTGVLLPSAMCIAGTSVLSPRRSLKGGRLQPVISPPEPPGARFSDFRANVEHPGVKEAANPSKKQQKLESSRQNEESATFRDLARISRTGISVYLGSCMISNTVFVLAWSTRLQRSIARKTEAACAWQCTSEQDRARIALGSLPEAVATLYLAKQSILRTVTQIESELWRGPHASASTKYENLILVARVFGISPYLAIMSDILHCINDNKPCLRRNILIVWAIKKSN
ncbi:hypothetical protein HYC85_017052 [Camellia sinensis]|uniref:Uncharacterized protein n=1 Tax=Camellia sinensis TaxID=4442 RepID=A0A7J7H4N6_CAMSI|nr:hypothetical protein HYC85_017052 [Camellia sinensis]